MCTYLIFASLAVFLIKLEQCLVLVNDWIKKEHSNRKYDVNNSKEFS